MKRTLSYEGVNPVVMVVRNALELTKAAVASVMAQDIPVQLRIVNNDSSDGTEAWLAQIPGIQVDTFHPGLSGAASWNFALTDVFRKFDHVLVLNNDVVLRSDFYGELLADGGPFVTGVSVDNAAAIEEDWRYSRRNHPDFSAFVMRREVWEKVGGFDEQFSPAYFEDNDYHIRMSKAGIWAYTIGIHFYHHASGTLKYSSESDARRIHEGAKLNREKFFKKWGCYPGTPEYDAIFI